MTELNKIVDQLSKLTVVEAAELSKQLEDKWGVTAAAPVAAAPVAATPAEEKSEFTVFLTAVGDKKINVIKGDFILSAFLTSTMGISYKLKLNKLPS